MNFDDLKVIWDTQEKEPQYAVNEACLHSMLREKSEKLKRLIFWQEAQTYASSGFVLSAISAFLIAKFAGYANRIGTIEVIALFLAFAGWAYFGGTVFIERRRQRQRSALFTSTLRDELERDLDQLDYEINARQHIVLGYIPPYAGGILFIWAFFRENGLTDWAMLPFTIIMITALIIESRGQRRLVEKKLIPKKEELEILRDKLTHPDR